MTTSESNTHTDQPVASLFGSPKLTPVVNMTYDSTINDMKRKRTDLNLEIVTIEESYDLTIIIGTPTSSHGQKAFQVNKGCFKNASSMWKAMFSGQWKESQQNEVEFPDDTPAAFEVVMRVAHLQFDLLPFTLSGPELVEVAKLCDKYDLMRILRPALQLKQWYESYKGNAWEKCHTMEELSVIIPVFGTEEDRNFFICELAVETLVSVDDVYQYRCRRTGQIKDLEAHLLPSVKYKALYIRDSILKAILTASRSAWLNVLGEQKDLCSAEKCSFMRIGILVKGLQMLESFPMPEHTS